MYRCIYCLETKPESEFNKEHVIPQAFGKFGSATPTLVNCVCRGCNDYFAKALDPVLSRDTYEGITRHAIGIKSREARPQNRVQLLLPNADEYGEFRGARVWLDGTVNGLSMHTQTGFLNKESGEREFFIDSEISDMESLPEHLADKDILVLAPSQDDHDRMVKILLEKKLIKKYELKETFSADGFPTTTKPMIKGAVDEMVRRALAKVAMNFAAKYIGVETVLSDEWNTVRRFVRYGEGEVASRASNRPFWGDETADLRIGSIEAPDAIYNIRIENKPEGIVAALEFSHVFLHEIIIVADGRLLDSKEVAYAFIPGEEPVKGIKANKKPPAKL